MRKQVGGNIEQAGRLSQDPVDWLYAEFSERRLRNPRYSLRAFARYLSIGSGALSEILARKRTLSLKQGKRFALRLGYSEKETELFLEPIASQTNAPVPTNRYETLSEDSFALISDWYHYAIREIIGTLNFKNDASWIARRLGISPSEVKEALSRLERLNLIERRGNSWRNLGAVTTPFDIPSAALRKFHRQALHRGLVALDEVPVGSRDISSITVGINPANLAQAKKKIKKFRRQMAALLEKGQKTQVYQLNIQLIPVTNQDDSE